MKKIFLIIIITAILAVPPSVHAIMPSEGSEYLFHLYFSSTNQLVADRDFKFSYDIISDVFVQPSVGQFPYRGEIINFAGDLAASFKFDVHASKLSAEAPYVADGQKVIFYDNQNQPVLTIPVSDSSFCNDDGICNADRGEDSLTCPKDCSRSLPVPVASAAPPAAVSGSNGVLSAILYLVIGLVLAGLVWWFLKRRDNSRNISLPPSLPTPAPPPNPNNPV